MVSPASLWLWLPAWGVQKGCSTILGVVPCFALPSAGTAPVQHATSAPHPAGPLAANWASRAASPSATEAASSESFRHKEPGLN